MTLESIQDAAAAAERVELPADLPDQESARVEDPAAEVAPDDPGRDAPPPDTDQPDMPEIEGAKFELNDYGNGRRLAHYYGENLRHVARLGWFRWDGQRWVSDEDGVSVRQDAQQIGARILHEIPCIALSKYQRNALETWLECQKEYDELNAVPRDDRSDEQSARFKELVGIRNAGTGVESYLRDAKKTHRAHAKASGNSSKITNMMAEAEVTPKIRINVQDLNANPYMVNTRNGVLHFVPEISEHDAAWPSKGQDPKAVWRVDLLPHDRKHMITKMIEADYTPDAPAKAFKRFFERVQPDPEIRDFLQRFAGYSLLGITSEQKLVFNFGIGRNGKSTLMDALADLLADYGTTLPIESLTGSEQRKGSEATPDLVRLPGARFVRASEPEQGTKMKEALIKSLTGGEAILIRRMHAEFIEVVPEFKLWISGNHKPEIRGADDGIWRRVMLVPWAVQIPDDEVDGQLPAKLRQEGAGILAWMVEGALKYLNDGLPIPAAVKEATQDYRTFSDPMREFLTTECIVTDDEKARVTAPQIRDAFNAWRLAMAENTWTSNTVSRRLAERAGVIKTDLGRSFEKYKSNGETGWKYLLLKPSALQRLSEMQADVDADNRRGR